MFLSRAISNADRSPLALFLVPLLAALMMLLAPLSATTA